jgi:hypothetical protein
MATKFATFIAGKAIVLFGAMAEAKVPNSLEGLYDFSIRLDHF